MNKSQGRQWRRAMRKHNKQVQSELAYAAVLSNGSFNRDQLVSFSYSPTRSGTYTRFNNKSGSKAPKHGDFLHTTNYNVASATNDGCAFLAYTIKAKSGADWSYCSCSNQTTGGTNFVGAYPSRYSALVDASQRALNSKLFNMYPSWDVLTDAVELKRTFRDCRVLIRAVNEIGIGILRRDPHQVLMGFGVKPTKKRVKHVSRVITEYEWQHGSRAIDAASNLWLSYRFGLMPTLKSIDDAMRAGAGLRSVSCEYTAQVTLADSQNGSTKALIGSTSNQVGYAQVTGFAYTASVRMKAFVTYKYGIRAALAQNPFLAVVRTGWEQVPFSFMVDRFYDVSSWINSLQLPSIIADCNVNVSVKQHTYINRSLSDITPPPSPYTFKLVANGGVLNRYRYNSFKRYKGSTSSVPPTLENGLSSMKRELDALFLGYSQSKDTMNRSLYHRH